MPGVTLVNAGDPERGPGLHEDERRVPEIQARLHRWAGSDPRRRFDDLFNLVCDPAFLRVAWCRVRGNRGARSAGAGGMTAWHVENSMGVGNLVAGLRADLKARSFRPLPVRERMIPEPGTSKKRRPGISTVRDKVVQAALKLVPEPVFEAGFLPCSYGFRPEPEDA
jgi:RNA-directed DNA polymerase